MITIVQAVEAAEKLQPGFMVIKILDLGEKWGACFDSGNPPVPGIPIITITKEAGEAGILTIPPLENLPLINSAPVAWSRL